MIQITLPAATDQLAAHHGTHDTVSGDCYSEIVTTDHNTLECWLNYASL